MLLAPPDAEKNAMSYLNRLMRTVVACLLAFVIVFANPVHACNWDTETLLQERSRFPTALEIIVGKFPRHSKAYYQWRLQDRLEKIKQSGANDLLLDDIAVSYEKLGRYDEAIQVATEQLQRNPDRYESLANLGTFLIHSGKFQAGLVQIEKAIEVNPSAHFGREKYQVILVKYVLSRRSDDGLELPLAQERFKGTEGRYDLPFYDFLKQNLSDGTENSVSSQELDEAAKGILGMMRFSRHDSPILLEALGELQEAMSARQLAYRAYMSASFHAEDAEAKARYETLAKNVVEWSRESWRHVKGVSVSEEELAEDFRSERADADEWYAKLVADERKWIAMGEPVDQRFNEKYREIPDAIVTDPETERSSLQRDPWSPIRPFVRSIALCVTIVLAILGTLLAYWLRFRHRSDAIVQDA